MAFRTLVMTRTTTEKIARPSKRASTLPNNVPASARERPDEKRAEDRLPDKEKTTVVYCAGGVRSAMAADILQKLGYRNVISMAGGFNRWKDSGKPWTTPASFTPEQAQRYSRHLLIPEVGEAGQQKLLKSKVLLIGAGGLGSPAAYYLASAGVGTLGIVDSDVVDLTNLQRQILHSTARIGEPKVEAAKRTL